MDFRLAALERWLGAQFPAKSVTLAPASEDASFRRYWRLSLPDGRSFVVMDAPPEKENCGAFLHAARAFAEAGVHVPRIHAQDLDSGFLLLEDLGNTTYLDFFRDHDPKAPYAAATDALIRIQLASRPGILPEYDRALLERELHLFPDWYIERELRRKLVPSEARNLRDVFEALLANNLAQPRVFVHRDYHSRNLMVCDPLPGILDFQDAVYGPISYDLVSLFRDAYVRWEEAQVLDWVARYWEKARKARLPVREDFAEFYRDFEWMGAQRQIKVVGIFARLCHRDGKERYLADIPRVLGYLLATTRRYRELAPLAQLLDTLASK
ncbi:MAG: aminoglycoside phosphotransferase [Betaproteobacteria bacterium RBG_16_66_20]|nr:MAG: aminoglycoside phosphotransferase [Betaproteobacteria bacterium RBG_16_66_20]